MQVIRGLSNLIPQPNGCVVTIGNFDGVHIGHQALLAKTKEQALARGLPSLAITFEPLPVEYFSRQKPQLPRLMRFARKNTSHCRDGH